MTEEINKIVVSSNDDKRMQSIDSIETYAYVEKTKLNVIIYQNNIKKFNFDYIRKEDIKEHNPKWPEIHTEY